MKFEDRESIQSTSAPDVHNIFSHHLLPVVPKPVHFPRILFSDFPSGSLLVSSPAQAAASLTCTAEEVPGDSRYPGLRFRFGPLVGFLVQPFVTDIIHGYPSSFHL